MLLETKVHMWSQLECGHVFLVNPEHPEGKWLLFVLRKKRRIGIVLAVLGKVLLVLVQGEWGGRVGWP